MLQEKSCGAVVFRENGTRRYLLLKYSNYWGFPKGLVEEGESEEEAAKREVEEETGIREVKFMPKFKEEERYFYKNRGETVHKTAVYFLAKTEERDVDLSFEHEASEWLPIDKAIERLTYDNHKKLLRKAHKLLSSREKSLDEFVKNS